MDAVGDIDRALRSGCSVTRAEIERAAGLERGFLEAALRALGVGVPATDEPAFDADDVEAWTLVGRLLRLGWSEEELLRVMRSVGRQTRRIAAAAVESYLRTVLRPANGEPPVTTVAEHAAGVAPLLAPLVAVPLRAHVRDLVRAEALRPPGLRAADLDRADTVAVAFVDIVHFTRLSKRLGMVRAAAASAELEASASLAAVPPVRFVKLIGDAAMLVAPDAAALVEAVRRILEEGAHEGHVATLHAGGAFGRALPRAGDWFGPPVNLASHLTERAEPGAFVVSADLAKATAERVRWHPLGLRPVPGLDEPVDLYRLA